MNYTEKELVIDGVKITVRRPILSADERQKRETKLCNALAEFNKALNKRSDDDV